MRRRVLLIPAALCAASAAVWLAVSDAPEAGAPGARPDQVRQGHVAPAQPDSNSPASQPAVAPASVVGKDDVARWVAESASEDPRTRAAAIIALAHAPKDLALPALHRVLEGPSADEQQIALSSLHTIAIDQGDDDGRIRNTIRGAIYHGSDESVSGNAQALLEDIEAAIAAQVR